MAREPVAHLVGAVESPAAGRKGALVARGAYGVKRVVFPAGEMTLPARRLLRKRLGSELDAVRDLLRKAESLTSGAGAIGAAGPAAEDGRFLAAEPRPEAPVEDDGIGAAKRRKVSPFVQPEGAPRRMTPPDQRERLAGRLATLAAVLPDHVVAFLQNQSGGDADPHGDGGEVEIDVHSMKEGALSCLKTLLDKFAPEGTPKSHERAAVGGSGVSCLSQHQDAADKIAPVDVDDLGGVSPVALRDIAEEYGELVDAIGVQLLSPLPRKYIDLAEHDEYVDICGDASPVVFPAKAGETSSSSSDFDTSSSDSDSESSSDSDSDESVSITPPPPPPPALITSSPPAPATLSKDNVPQEQAPEAVQSAEQEESLDQCAKPAPTTSRSPALAALPKDNDTSAQPQEPAPEAVQSAEQEESLDQCAKPAPTTSRPPAPAAPPKDNDTSAQSSQAAHSAELEVLRDQHAEPAPTVRLITSSPPAPAALPKDNDKSAQPPEPATLAMEDDVPAQPPEPASLPKENDASAQPPEPAPEPVRIAEPEGLHDLSAAPKPTAITNLIAKAQDALERRRQEEKERAREKARRELLEVERAALPDERIHPRDMEALGIAAFEHVVSTVVDARTARPRVSCGGGLRVAPGGPSVLQQLGLFLKADGGGGGEEEERRLGLVPDGGRDMEMEEGEIR
ncbi:hypothetical protein ACP70R_027310 [Stipagrostis hirtigluma subsp. patula]